MDEAAKYTDKLPFWDMLDGEQKDFVRSSARIMSFEKNSLVHSGTNACLGMIYILKGGIRAYLLSEEGREITLFRAGEDEICVFSASCVISQITFDTEITAVDDCEFLVLGSGAFDRLTKENINARCFIYELLIKRFSSVMWTMQQLLFLRFDRRLAAFLIEEYDRTGNPEIRMTHEQIARHVSSAREVVARMAASFAADGLIETGRGVIKILDAQRLRKLI